MCRLLDLGGPGATVSVVTGEIVDGLPIDTVIVDQPPAGPQCVSDVDA